MKRQLVVVLSAALVVAAASAALVASAAGTSRAGARHGAAAQKFVGYWMGIDPLDGGDSRRGITKRSAAGSR